MEDDGDIQVEYGGQRMCWRAVSERGRVWVAAHADQVLAAPKGTECLRIFAEPIVEQALRDGLAVKVGDVEVSLCP
jgi:hypothetical protein